MILIGAGVIIFKSIIGVVVLLGGIAIVFLHYGLLIDFDEHKYKEYWGLLGLKFGKWEDLPPVEYISLTQSRFTQQIGLRAANTTLKGVLYRGNLRINEQEKILLLQSHKKDEALKQLKYLAKRLGTKLLDCTKSGHEWVEF